MITNYPYKESVLAKLINITNIFFIPSKRTIDMKTGII